MKYYYEAPEVEELQLFCPIAILSTSNQNAIESGEEDSDEYQF